MELNVICPKTIYPNWVDFVYYLGLQYLMMFRTNELAFRFDLPKYVYENETRLKVSAQILVTTLSKA